MNRRNTQLLVCLLLLASTALSHGQLLFTTNNGAITITGYTGSDSQVIIPSTTNGWPVTAIGVNAFQNNTTISSVTIPVGVTNIGVQAFDFCANLARISIPNSVKTIGNLAFGSCSSLTNIVVPDSVTNLGDNAFFLCGALTNAQISTNITSIGNGAFSGCSNLAGFPIGSKISYIGTNAFSGCSHFGGVTIPDAVTTIGGGAFYQCFSLTNITFGSNIANIGDDAFENCTNLQSISFPDSVTNIGYGVCAGCSRLTNFSIGSGAVTIGVWSGNGNTNNIGGAIVDGCIQLSAITVDPNNPNFESVDGVLLAFDGQLLVRCPLGKAGNYTIPDTVTNTSWEAFDGCSNLANITFNSSGLLGMGLFAFYGCNNVTNIILNSGFLTHAEAIDFMDLFGLKTITVDSNNPAYIGLDGVLYDRNETTLIAYPAAKTTGSYTIPNGVALIQSNAFNLCFSLTNVTVPSTVTNIGSSAFSLLYNLTGVYFEGNAPAGVNMGLMTLYFEFGLLNVYYLPGMTGWTSRFDGFPGAPTTPWLLPQPLILNNCPGFGIQTNQFGFTVSWATNASIVVEASTNLTTASWQPIATNSLTAGTFHFNDANWTNYPGRFYRLRSP
jgi:hypothetical protein